MRNKWIHFGRALALAALVGVVVHTAHIDSHLSQKSSHTSCFCQTPSLGGLSGIQFFEAPFPPESVACIASPILLSKNTCSSEIPRAPPAF